MADGDSYVRADRDSEAQYDTFAEWLSPVQRGDVQACVIEGHQRAGRARKRGLIPDTISQNIPNSRARPAEAAEREGDHV